MKNTYISVLVLVVVIVGAIFMFGRGHKAMAPVAVTEGTPVVNAAGVKEFTITGSNFSFTPSLITVKKGDKVKINFKNADGFHNLIIDELGVTTKTVKGGESDSVEFVASKAGTFQYYCSVGTHRAMGMWGTIKVE